jgi:hypothetical protein
LWLILLTCGCRHVVHRTATTGHDSGAATLPAIVRTGIEIDLNKLPTGPKEVAFTGSYHALTEQDCQCLAAGASRMASLLEEAQGLVGSHGRSSLQDVILQTAAVEARNKDASTALELYFRLAEAEARRDLLADSLKEVRDAVAGGEKLKKQGLKVPPEFEEFHKQQLDLQTDDVRLEGVIYQLNQNLAKMLNVKLAPDTQRLWPVADFQPAEDLPSPEQAVALGLEQRPEVQLLRRAPQEMTTADLAAARSLLASSNVLLGSDGTGILGKIKVILRTNETEVRRNQLEQLAAQREAEIADEIRQAAVDLRTQSRLVALARMRVVHARTKLKDQEAKRAKGALSAVDVTPARLAWLKAKSDLVHEVMAWHIARVKLKQAQGLLAAECGYGGHATPLPQESSRVRRRARRTSHAQHQPNCPLALSLS